MRGYAIIFGVVIIGSIFGMQESFATGPSPPFSADITISYPPNLNETAILTLTVTNASRSNFETIEQLPTIIRLPTGLELVSGELETTHFWQRGNIIEVNVIVRAVQTGNWTIQGVGGGGVDYLYLVIDENSSYIHDGIFPPSNSNNKFDSIYQEHFSKDLITAVDDGYNVVFKFVSPKKQIEKGISFEEIKCNNHLQLIFKPSDGSPACVKPETVEKLIYRNWIVQGERVIFITEKTQYKVGEPITVTMKNVGTVSLQTPSIPIGFSVYDQSRVLCSWNGEFEALGTFTPLANVTYTWNQKACLWSDRNIPTGTYTFKADHLHRDMVTLDITISE